MPTTESDAIAAWIFRRLLGLVYLIAFWSMARQAIGLIGHDGILPAATYMDQIRGWAGAEHLGIDRFRLFPTVFWISASDAFLTSVCVAGMILSALMIAGFAPLAVLPILWMLYLSLTVVGQDFLLYQWDALLLETGFLAIFIAPAVWRDRLRDATSLPRLGKWLVLWLLFRLTVGSGAIKLASGDPTWRSLTALTFHYQTQPIPNPIAWYAHQLPIWFQKISAAAVLAIDLIVPLLIIAPRRARIVACIILVGLQAFIALTGNYAFFNLLSAALCVLLLDDRSLAAFRLFHKTRSAADLEPGRASPIRRGSLVAVAILTVPVTLLTFSRSFRVQFSALQFVAPIAALIFPFHSVNTYGLFAVMTTTRPEIIIEGSDDGVEWKAYEFRYKPGDLNRRPPFVAPHQPRLDWQMWFAAIGNYDSEPWFEQFCLKLLDGAPDVLALLEHNPFPRQPPKYIRAQLFRYEFGKERWWTSEQLGSYSPVLSRR